MSQWRRLIKITVEAAEHPIQFRNPQRSADARARGIFDHHTGEMRLAQPAVQRQPGIDLELILLVSSDQAAVRILLHRPYDAASIVVNDVEKLVVLLSETVETHARVVPLLNPGHSRLAPLIF